MLKQETKDDIKEIGSNMAQTLKADAKKIDPGLIKNPYIIVALVVAAVGVYTEPKLAVLGVIVGAAIVAFKSNSPAKLAKTAAAIPVDLVKSHVEARKAAKEAKEKATSGHSEPDKK